MFNGLTLPCSQAVVEGGRPDEAILYLYGVVHAHDFRLVLSREMVETLRQSCEVYLKRTQDLVSKPEQLARAEILAAAAPERRP